MLAKVKIPKAQDRQKRKEFKESRKRAHWDAYRIYARKIYQIIIFHGPEDMPLTKAKRHVLAKGHQHQ